MKNKKFSGKLSIHRITVSNLNTLEQHTVRAGSNSLSCREMRTHCYVTDCCTEAPRCPFPTEPK